MSFQKTEHSNCPPVSRHLMSPTHLPLFLWSPTLILTLLACFTMPAGADVLFPNDYGNGEVLTFSGGSPGKVYELRIAQPGGNIVKASEALLDVSFLDDRRVKIQPQNVTPEVYRAFYGPSGAGGSTQVLAAVYIAGSNQLVDHTLVINTTYDPSPHFPNATFMGKQRWTTSVETIAGTTEIFSFPWTADHGGGKNWRLGNPTDYLGVRCEIQSNIVAILENAETDSELASLVTEQTDSTGTSGQVSIRFTAPPYKPGGDNDYTVRIHNRQDPYGIGGEGQPTGCSGSALDVQIKVTRSTSEPAVARVLFPHDYRSAQVLDFAGGTAGGNYELRVERPSGGMVSAAEALLDVTFVSHTQARIAPQRVAPDAYTGFYGSIGTGASTQLRAAVYIAGSVTLVDDALVVEASYDPSAQFQDAVFTGSQLWTTSLDIVESTTETFSFSWLSVYAGDKNWGIGDLVATSPIRCQIGSDHVAVMPNPPTDSTEATLIMDATDTTGTSGTVSIEYTAPPYNPDGSNNYTVRIYNRQDPHGIDSDDGAMGCNGSALDVRFAVSQGGRISPGAHEDGDLRLVNGATPDEGRLEIYYDGQWGTICDDYWTDDDADVACRQLGYEQGAVRYGGVFLQSHFGPADEGVPIWLDNMMCLGDESGLLDCPRAPQPGGTDPGQHNCSLDHLEDVGVRCETSELAAFSVDDDSTNEGGTLYFRVELSSGRESTTWVDYATVDGSATAGADYQPEEGTLVFNAGQRTKHVEVRVLDDSHDEGSETLTLVLSNPIEARIVRGEATGTIVNSDPLPKGWTARFGRTIAGHLVDALQARLEAPPDSYVRLGGYRLDGAAGSEAVALGSDWAKRHDPWEETGPAAPAGKEVTTWHLLTGSAFHLVSNEYAPVQSPRLTAWGRAAAGGFDGQSGGVSLDGKVATAMLGFDGEWDHWVAGVVLAHSKGDGTFGAAALPGGHIDSRLTSVHPYVAYRLNDSAWMWGMGGFGEGALTLAPHRGAALETDIGLAMGAVGARSALLAAARGPSLALETDGFWVRTTSNAVPGLVATDAVVTRARLALEGTYAIMLRGGSALAPKLGIGLRHDAGDAEKGWGVEIGGGVAWSATVPGLSVELEARTLLGHQANGFRDWSLSGLVRYDPNPSSEHGLSASLRSTLGTAALSGPESLLRPATLADVTTHSDWGHGEVAAEAAYGFAILGGRFTGAPVIGAAVLEHRRDYRLGYRISPARRSGSDIRIDVEGTQRQYAGAQAERAVRVRLAKNW